ncbi:MULTISPECIES: GspE/PulE family protein [unclassified Lentimonas]|uniref:GspE/PulE family protein n=1 Tax=unclassified Lentimonas TaxID=2630993 RepID=UPI0013207D9A|nr:MULTISPECIES: GspE/PulE family protein [unclassified Lentimonas]CAA6689694.1 Type IV fimbrial assembly, ATPase PilB [Lentimonas sp. CC19]CAA6690456.1 Type IV fimbrial assembly, ATPase PilB [Lentimonas sp. CC10]CAA7068715.1 Type IV fimbrial assembly, ATPase PilB [Lentimonas sp. CC11]
MSMTIREELEASHILISNEAYDLARANGEENSLELLESLIESGAITKDVGCHLWSNRLGRAYVDPLSTIISREAVESLPLEIARKGNVMPLYVIEDAMTVAMPNPDDAALVRRLSAITGLDISPVFCLSVEVRDAIELHYSTDQTVQELIAQLERTQGAILSQLKPEELEGAGGAKSIIGLCDALLYLAIKERASDIHIEPQESFTNIRFRVDGRLQQVFRVASALHAPLNSRIKILSELNIAETRIPQDGRISIPLGSGNVNFRVSVIPTIYGEKIVLRILALTGKKDFKSLDQMMISQTILQPFNEVIRAPNGMVFVTGPTGSGKSTTLYAALHEINKPDVNICTIEDPIETRMDGVIQSQVNAKIDLKFSTLLRSLLRQDPDVMLVGEIRDLETAKIAIEAALTGHLVFSTLHTNNAIQAVVRLVEIGIEPYMVAPSILAVMAQRLAARICENCKSAYTPEAHVLERYFHDSHSVNTPFLYHGVGCAHCRQTGYYGRIAFHELALVTEEMRGLITRGAPDDELTLAARRAGYRPLRYDALKKALLGFTTLDEVEARTTSEWELDPKD